MFITDAVILQGARTPMARYMGAFDSVSALELGALASKEAIRRAGTANAFARPPNITNHAARRLWGMSRGSR